MVSARVASVTPGCIHTCALTPLSSSLSHALCGKTSTTTWPSGRVCTLPLRRRGVPVSATSVRVSTQPVDAEEQRPRAGAPLLAGERRRGVDALGTAGRAHPALGVRGGRARQRRGGGRAWHASGSRAHSSLCAARTARLASMAAMAPASASTSVVIARVTRPSAASASPTAGLVDRASTIRPQPHCGQEAGMATTLATADAP